MAESDDEDRAHDRDEVPQVDAPQRKRTRHEAIVSPVMATFFAETGIPAAVRTDGTVHVTGHTGEDADLTFSPDPEHQIRRTFLHVAETLAAAGGSWSDVVSITSFHIGLRTQASALLAVSAEFLGEPTPAWSAVGVTELWDEGAVVEIACVAVIPGRGANGAAT
jgi:enamine deaminase RidA (YjgF/YER057c/UK114 family)